MIWWFILILSFLLTRLARNASGKTLHAREMSSTKTVAAIRSQRYTKSLRAKMVMPR